MEGTFHLSESSAFPFILNNPKYPNGHVMSFRMVCSNRNQYSYNMQIAKVKGHLDYNFDNLHGNIFKFFLDACFKVEHVHSVV